MEGNKSKKRAIMVFGAPCSGKTTFCEHFSKQFKAPFFNLDDLVTQHDFTRKQIIALIEQLAKTEATLVIEGGIGTEAERTELTNLLLRQHYSPSLIWIQTDVATQRTRLKNRLKSIAKAKAEYDERIKQLEAPSELEHPIVLSGKHTYATQLKQVLTQLG